MFISKKHIPRRTFLRGAGASIALPFLDAMVPAATALAQTAAQPQQHLGFIYFPHGAVMDQWTPNKEGADFDLPPILSPLAPYQDQLTIISGLGNRPAESSSVHSITPCTWLSCVEPRVGHDPLAGITVDQIAAQQIGQDTPLPSIELATEKGGIDAACDRTYGCIHSSTISFRTPNTPLPMEYNPRKLFQNLFGRGNSEAEREVISKRYASVLDQVMDEAADMQKRLGHEDQVSLDNYLETVREIERRVQQSSSNDLSQFELPEMPVGIPDSHDEHLSLTFDLLALAYQSGMTRVASMMMQAEVSNMTFANIGVRDAFHPLSHHQNDASKIARLAQIQVYNSEVFAKFIDTLANMPDGDGSMLDHSIILYGSNMSDSNVHNNFPLPTAVLGGGCGTLQGNQHLRYDDHTPLSNLLLTLMAKAGVNLDSLGDSTGILAGV